MTLPNRRIEVPENYPPIPLSHEYREFGNGVVDPNMDEVEQVRHIWNQALDTLGLTMTAQFSSLTPGSGEEWQRNPSRKARLANVHLLNSIVTYVVEGDPRPTSSYSARQSRRYEYSQLELLEGASLRAAEGLGLYSLPVGNPDIRWGPGATENNKYEPPITVDDVLTDIARVTVGGEIRKWTEPRDLVRPEMFRPLLEVCMDLGTRRMLYDHL